MTAAQLEHLDPAVREKVQTCQNILRGLESVVVAYSGGVDSSLLLALALDALGRENVLAVMAVSTIFPQRELKAGREMARELGAEFVEFDTPLLADPAFTANPTDRCYYCKSRLLTELRRIADERRMKAVVTGANTSDGNDYRPGSRAEKEMGIRRPLLEAGLTKPDIRAAAAAVGLASADMPSQPCYATRVPYGQPVTDQKVGRIGRAEDLLHELGFDMCRVRDHGNLARVELPAADLAAALRHRERIVPRLKELGYAYVALDLQGYRTGAMNETIQQPASA